MDNAVATAAINEPEPGSLLIVSDCTSSRHKYKRTLSQVCALVAQSLLMMDLGMMIVVPTIVIGALHNAKEDLSLDDDQSSWIGSIMLLCQPLGCLLSGFVQGVLGRKRAMLLVNVPHLAAWYLLYAADSPWMLYTASVAMGIGIGFLEAPTMAYIGEISEPDIRGTLSTFASTFIVLGHLLEFMLGYLFSWREAMLISCLVPVTASIATFLIPESPVWLLMKGRRDEALSSLRWLRGWSSVEEVNEEFHKLELYCQESKIEFKNFMEAKIRKSSGYTGVPDSEFVTQKKPSVVDMIRDFLRPGILIPLRLVVAYFFFFHAASLTAMRPYMIEVFTRLDVPLTPNKLTVISAVLQVTGAITCICLVRLVGKRTLSLVSMSGCALCCLSLGVYTYTITQLQWSTAPTIPLLLFCTLYFTINLGISPIPWLLISEVFPTRGREVAGSLCAAIFYVNAFLVSKTWINLQNLVELYGCFFLYGILAVVGIVHVFIYLPETEGKTLSEIEKDFARKNAR
ncbi:facilitated trehalose transporter Tret1-like isoform X1 [Rhopalosiphum padi]|uniref:facilitated trehalose transporter Tret1-like isoform X1 n=2 Tax=Rhopalosiphum padi TaxID=40932 RepID=UPI00298DB51E|nr:facilitated trehalose transporter Tret1-like isoform X1 [Rhopalosiphum padi]